MVLESSRGGVQTSEQLKDRATIWTRVAVGKVEEYSHQRQLLGGPGTLAAVLSCTAAALTIGEMDRPETMLVT